MKGTAGKAGTMGQVATEGTGALQGSTFGHSPLLLQIIDGPRS